MAAKNIKECVAECAATPCPSHSIPVHIVKADKTLEQTIEVSRQALWLFLDTIIGTLFRTLSLCAMSRELSPVAADSEFYSAVFVYNRRRLAAPFFFSPPVQMNVDWSITLNIHQAWTVAKIYAIALCKGISDLAPIFYEGVQEMFCNMLCTVGISVKQTLACYPSVKCISVMRTQHTAERKHTQR